MAYYNSPAEMFAKRAERARKMGDLHWAQAKNGEGGHHYTQAKRCYEQAATGPRPLVRHGDESSRVA